MSQSLDSGAQEAAERMLPSQLEPDRYPDAAEEPEDMPESNKSFQLKPFDLRKPGLWDHMRMGSNPGHVASFC